MVNDEIVKYVRHMRAKGVSDKNIKRSLLAQGWSESDILGALWYDPNMAEEEEQKRPLKKRRRPTRLLPMIVLLAILWFAALLYLRVWDPPWNPMPEPPTEFTNELPFI